ncbi:hypothetical protein DO97_05290 [Neosynechococcus sphagnicola sy1]|uniref:Uncharacterized protein n=1 Tax=Neosynechococcus sphagnicola sy1 TaxID=1497020 RepID=A0A098TKC4_9CYAN|nr:hypothetical protein [Neosynechococcus sphagnicola]KGF72749.1 hypothetical protein DO97_05290 [Neosynechococcus sphagnicola sy1]
MEAQTLQTRVAVVREKRECLVRLLEEPSLGILRIDVNQALEEIDDLLDELKQTFPETTETSE